MSQTFAELLREQELRTNVRPPRTKRPEVVFALKERVIYRLPSKKELGR